jgi:hypothetical protein
MMGRCVPAPNEINNNTNSAETNFMSILPVAKFHEMAETSDYESRYSRFALRRRVRARGVPDDLIDLKPHDPSCFHSNLL